MNFYIVVPTCHDNVMNGNETGIDCGGLCLPSKQCPIGSRCESKIDCISSVCISNICQGKTVICSVKYLNLSIVAPTCDDGIKNADETDMDCGGSCLPTKRCKEALKCVNPADCISGVCRSSICQGKSILCMKVRTDF